MQGIVIHDSGNPDGDFALSDFDARCRHVVSTIWVLPFQGSARGGPSVGGRRVAGEDGGRSDREDRQAGDSSHAPTRPELPVRVVARGGEG